MYSIAPIFRLSQGRSHNLRRDLASSPRMDAGNHGVTAFSANSKTNEQNKPASVVFFGFDSGSTSSCSCGR
ncbi:unnamed protein product [Brassica rapa subsp. narinosa]